MQPIQRHRDRMQIDSNFLCGVAFGAASTALCYKLLASQKGSGKAGVSAPPESTIRLMTRLAIQHGAVNLSQGFPNEPPPREMVLAAAGALIDGATLDTAERCAAKLDSLLPAAADSAVDSLNQYSYPFGIPMLRQAIEKYYGDFYPGVPADAEKNLTVCLGATEGFAICLRAICQPADHVVFFQPFHELYPNQCTSWGLTPKAVTLYETSSGSGGGGGGGGGWAFSEVELENALAGASCLLFNSPHNPTGKVFMTGADRALVYQARCHGRHRRNLRAHVLRRHHPHPTSAAARHGRAHRDRLRRFEDGTCDGMACRMGGLARAPHADHPSCARPARVAGGHASAGGSRPVALDGTRPLCRCPRRVPSQKAAAARGAETSRVYGWRGSSRRVLPLCRL